MKKDGKLYHILFSAILLIFAQNLFCQKTLVIDTIHESYNPTAFLCYIEDPKNEFDSTNISSGLFKEINKRRPIWGTKRLTFWFKLHIKNASHQAIKMILDVQFESILMLDVFSQKQDSSLKPVQSIGNNIKLSNRTIRNRYTPVLYTLQPDENSVLYFRLQSSREVDFLLTVRTEKKYYQDELHERYVLGAYTGFFLMIIILNLFFFFTFKDSIYIWYICLCATIGISVLSFEGMQLPLLSDYSIWLTNNMDVINVIIAQITSAIFVIKFLDIKLYFPKIYKVLLVNVFLVVILESLFLITNYFYLYLASYYTITFSFILYLMAGIILAKRGYKHAITFVLAYIILGISIIGWVISDHFVDITIGISPKREMLVGSIIEMLVLTYALSVRMKELRIENEQMRTALIKYISEIDELKLLLKTKVVSSEKFELQTIERWNLTRREAEVLKLISLGYSNVEIAEKLFVSINTVKFHTKNIYEKLNAGNRVEVISKISAIKIQ